MCIICIDLEQTDPKMYVAILSLLNEQITKHLQFNMLLSADQTTYSSVLVRWAEKQKRNESIVYNNTVDIFTCS